MWMLFLVQCIVQMSKCVCERERDRLDVCIAVGNKSKVEITALSYPSVSSPCSLVISSFSAYNHPSSIRPTHSSKNILPSPSHYNTSLPISFSTLSLPFASKEKSPPPSICSDCNSIMEAVSREVSDDVLEENAGNSVSQSSTLSILSFPIPF